VGIGVTAVLWALQGLLAAVFLTSGIVKSVQTKERMIATGQTGVAPFPLPVIRVVAAAEILGAIGLVLPWAMQVLPALTVAAAAGLCIVMIGAAISHWSLHEYKQVFGVNLLLLLMLIAVIIGRSTQLL
jgi:uncharacterized membrane protein YphA (DoxX/SURF4 family)